MQPNNSITEVFIQITLATIQVNIFLSAKNKLEILDSPIPTLTKFTARGEKSQACTNISGYVASRG